MSPSEISTLKIFLSIQFSEFVTFNGMFSMFFRFLRTLPQDPIRGSPVGNGTPLLSRSETNFWLRTLVVGTRKAVRITRINSESQIFPRIFKEHTKQRG